jgi:hypothetical protein
MPHPAMRPLHFFKYHTADVAKIVLSTQKVRWNSPLNFNDPFDCYFSLEAKFDRAQMAKKYRKCLLDLLSQEEEPRFAPGNPYSSILSAWRGRVKGTPRERLEERLGSDLEEYAGRVLDYFGPLARQWREEVAGYRLFCVCEASDNLLLCGGFTAPTTQIRGWM